MNPNVKRVLRAARSRFERLSDRIEGYDPVGRGTVPRALKIHPRVGDGARDPRIVFLLPADDFPVGGNKVSYRQCEIIDRQGTECLAFHPERPGVRYTWFAHEVRTLDVGEFDPRRDFLVFSEMWAAIAARFCIPPGLRYAIYVQNGYLTHQSAGFGRDVLQHAYDGASLVLSISEDTTRMIQIAYPSIAPQRILRLFHSVGPQFSPGNKQRLITYMPRKLAAHSERLCFYLRSRLPDGWQIRPIENLDERGVAALMAQSSVFLSFSELEGCPLPPLEAALAGNIVVGYTGQGAREYFTRPIFREIPNGDFAAFVDAVQVAVEDAERGVARSPDLRAQMASLASTHSVENETRHLLEFVARVRGVMGRTIE